MKGNPFLWEESHSKKERKLSKCLHGGNSHSTLRNITRGDVYNNGVTLERG